MPTPDTRTVVHEMLAAVASVNCNAAADDHTTACDKMTEILLAKWEECERLTTINERLNAAILDLQEMVSAEQERANERGAVIAALKSRLAATEAVVTAACRLVAADTYVHPMLSRADAVKAGVAELHDAVGKWQSEQPAQQALSTYEGKSE